MPKRFYKHKLLLDEHISPRQFLSHLNAHFDVKHIKHDLHHAGLDDPSIYELAVSQGRIILSKRSGSMEYAISIVYECHKGRIHSF